MTTNPTIQYFGEPIDIYTLEDALEDGILVKVGELQPSELPVVFTRNLFEDVKDYYKDIIAKGLDMLIRPDSEDNAFMKLRVIEKDKIWVIANPEGVTFMKPEDY